MCLVSGNAVPLMGLTKPELMRLAGERESAVYAAHVDETLCLLSVRRITLSSSHAALVHARPICQNSALWRPASSTLICTWRARCYYSCLPDVNENRAACL